MQEKDEVLEYMINREWEKESKLTRKKYLLELAKESKDSSSISSKIGGMLIFNQITEQLLKEVIVSSIAYVKAEIWPTDVEFSISISKATFGKLIEFFKQFAIKQNNSEELVKFLEKLNVSRNEIVHKLFDIDEVALLGKKLDKYGELAESVIVLLMKYYSGICEYFYDLDRRVDFEDLLEI